MKESQLSYLLAAEMRNTMNYIVHTTGNSVFMCNSNNVDEVLDTADAYISFLSESQQQKFRQETRLALRHLVANWNATQISGTGDFFIIEKDVVKILATMALMSICNEPVSYSVKKQHWLPQMYTKFWSENSESANSIIKKSVFLEKKKRTYSVRNKSLPYVHMNTNRIHEGAGNGRVYEPKLEAMFSVIESLMNREQEKFLKIMNQSGEYPTNIGYGSAIVISIFCRALWTRMPDNHGNFDVHTVKNFLNKMIFFTCYFSCGRIVVANSLLTGKDNNSNDRSWNIPVCSKRPIMKISHGIGSMSTTVMPHIAWIESTAPLSRMDAYKRMCHEISRNIDNAPVVVGTGISELGKTVKNLEYGKNLEIVLDNAENAGRKTTAPISLLLKAGVNDYTKSELFVPSDIRDRKPKVLELFNNHRSGSALLKAKTPATLFKNSKPAIVGNAFDQQKRIQNQKRLNILLHDMRRSDAAWFFEPVQYQEKLQDIEKLSKILNK